MEKLSQSLELLCGIGKKKHWYAINIHPPTLVLFCMSGGRLDFESRQFAHQNRP